MLSPMGFATLVVLLVVLPVFFIVGRERLVLRARCPLVCAGGAGVHAGHADGHAGAVHDALVERAGAATRVTARAVGRASLQARALSRIVTKPRAVAAAAVVAALAGLAVIPALDGPVIPSFKDRNLVVHLDGPPGTSRGEMSRIVARASRDLRAVPGVSDVAGHVGRAVTGDQVVDVNSSELWVKVASDADYDATRTSIDNVLKNYAGLNRAVLTYEKQRIRDVGAVDDRQAEDAGTPQLRPRRADGNRPAAAGRARLRREPDDPAAAGGSG